MEFHIKRTALSVELGRVQGVVDKKAAVPILGNVLIENGPGFALRFTATNMSSTLFSTATADSVVERGALCVPARRFYDIVRSLPEGMVHVASLPNGHVQVRAKGANFRIPGAEPDHFPTPPPLDGLTWSGVPARLFRSLVKGVNFAIAPEEDTRYNLRGAKLQISDLDQEMSMSATDGHRLSLVTAPLSSLLADSIDLLIPKSALDEVDKLLADYDGELSIAHTDTHAYFRAGERVLVSTLGTGDFPDIKLIISNGTEDTFVTYEAAELVQSLKRAQLVADTVTTSVKMDFVGETLTMTAETPEAGEASMELPSNFNGEDMTLYASAKFLVDYLDLLGATIVTVGIKDANTVLHFRAEKDGATFRYLTMPMAVPGV